MTTGSKTPVSILQEYCVANKSNPKYELIVNDVGSHQPTFVYRVSLGDLFADGKGQSKQVAKHNAAQMLIEILQSKKVEDSDELENATKILSLPQENCITFNAVGNLVDYCVSKCHPEPEYTLISESGPPHSKTFTMKCSVSQLNAYGQARTKKQAKQTAAYNMTRQLMELTGENPNAVVKAGPNNSDSPSKAKQWEKEDAERDIENKFSALTKFKCPPSNSACISDHHKTILNLVTKSPTLNDLISQDIENQCKLNIDTLNLIANELGVNLDIIEFEIQPQCYFCKLNIKPPLVCSGSSIEEAKYRLLKLFLSFFSLVI